MGSLMMPKLLIFTVQIVGIHLQQCLPYKARESTLVTALRMMLQLCGLGSLNCGLTVTIHVQIEELHLQGSLSNIALPSHWLIWCWPAMSLDSELFLLPLCLQTLESVTCI